MLYREEGQITVFLSLVFLLLLGVSLCVMEGMYCFMESSLAEDSMKGAGNYVLASYNRNLFDRYHIFFLDPKEKSVIEEDGKEYLSGYAEGKSFFQFSCSRIAVTEERTAVDEDGLYLKHQIREWMKYRETVKAGKALQNLLGSADDTETGRSLAKSDMGKAEEAIAEAERKAAEEAAQGEVSDNEGEIEQGTEENPTTEEKTAQDAGEAGVRWKELKELLTNFMQSGILLYVADDGVSKLAVSLDDVPSGQRVSEEETENLLEGALSFLNVNEWKKLLEDIPMHEWDGQALADEFYLLEYIEEGFGSYVSESEEESALKYEIEYLIAGKDSDMENLKSIANRILGLRFLSNYMYLSQNSEWNTVSANAAAALTGVLGFPQAAKAVQILLTAALSFGESLVDVHALFEGEKVPIMKDASTWNLTLENAATILKNKGPVKKGKTNADYADYLKLFLVSRMQRSQLLYRMMDIMQMNVALKEPGFLMQDSLFAFRWEADFACGGLFSFFPGFGRGGNGGFTVKMERLHSY